MNYWVVDANLVVNTALNISDSLEQFWESLSKAQAIPCAPRLWMSETTSAVRFYLSQELINVEEARQAVQTIHGLRVEILDEDEELCQRALELAGKLGQSKAYDAFYLALAEKLASDFWTADKRLASCCKDLKLPWVHWVGD